MLRITVNRSAAGAKKYYSEAYYSEGHAKQNYYSEKDNVIGVWGGKGAAKLGLNGDIDKNDFASLCDNLIPGTNQKLNPRNNIDKRVGSDLTFNASKSVTLAYAFASPEEKKQMLKAFTDSVKETMCEIESAMQTRVRRQGQNSNRETGNIAYGMFVHFTSRPVDGISDPHLHAHCFVFNTTHDQVEQKWKAGEFGQINKDAPYYEVVFHSTFASKLKELGYNIEKAKTGFELKGVSKETRDKFSRRTKEIEHLASEKNITDKTTKAQLGAKTRESKRKSTTEHEQEKNWNQRLTKEERLGLSRLKSGSSSDDSKKDGSIVAKEALTYSLDHHLERKSVTTDKEILATALKTSLGQVTPDELKTAFAKYSSVISVKENYQTFITTKAVLQEENTLITKALATKGTFKPINENYQPKNQQLSDEQKNAAQHVLTTSDGITIIVGKAGTGKTTLMKEVQSGIIASGKNIFALAPSAEASRGIQRSEGFKNAETLAAFFHSKELQAKAKNSVIWGDEAGMMSNRDMNRLLDIAKEQNARVILTGDTKQHNSVERGDALRVIIKEAGIAPVQISKIQRQKNQSYQEAVSFLAKADVEKGFRKLDKMGTVYEIADSSERIKKVADDYVLSTHGKNGNQPLKEVLVVSPTHTEGDRVTEQIRQRLKEQKVISSEERAFKTFKNIQLTEAEKRKTENYTAGNWVILQQNAKGFKAGSRYEIVGTDKANVHVKNNEGKTLTLSTLYSSRYNVFEPQVTTLSKGDKLRITGNGHAFDGKSLFNGTMYNVSGFDRQGNIKLSNGSTISKDFGQFSLGYVLTSHASQGKTVDKVIISQSSMSFRASSQEQFYVSVSRGRKAVAIYTDNKADLLRAVSQSNERKSAIDLNRQKQAINHVIDINRKGLIYRIRERALDVVQKVKKINKAGYGLQRNITKETGRSR